jgi:hypothetical protein
MHRLVLITIAEVRLEHRHRSCPRTVKRRPRAFPTRKAAAQPPLPPPSSAPTIRILAPSNLHTDDKPVVQDPRSCGKRFWWEHVRGWKRSGETRTDYCRRHALPLASFKIWVARLRHRLRKPNALI